MPRIVTLSKCIAAETINSPQWLYLSRRLHQVRMHRTPRIHLAKAISFLAGPHSDAVLASSYVVFLGVRNRARDAIGGPGKLKLFTKVYNVEICCNDFVEII